MGIRLPVTDYKEFMNHSSNFENLGKGGFGSSMSNLQQTASQSHNSAKPALNLSTSLTLQNASTITERLKNTKSQLM